MIACRNGGQLVTLYPQDQGAPGHIVSIGPGGSWSHCIHRTREASGHTISIVNQSGHFLSLF